MYTEKNYIVGTSMFGCQRATLAPPIGFTMTGTQVGDRNGYAISNKYGMGDVLVSAPGASSTVTSNVRLQGGTPILP